VPVKGAPEVGYCPRCSARECLHCAKRLGGRCAPFERTLDRHARRQAFLKSIGG
jgi:hypothetical protein